MSILRENPIAEELIQIGLQEGRQEGRQEGLQEGLQAGFRDGEVKGLQEALLDLMEYQFESVPDDLRRAVLALRDVDRLRALHRQSARAASLEQFRADASL